MPDDNEKPIPAIFGTIHHRSPQRPNGYTPEDISWMNVIANKHIPELYQELLAAHRAAFPGDSRRDG
ncbi:hypothetical protein [Phenylobacterium sp.]|jgi:hypothetical protein|uniref:hypothetical protein n=1 Tax=Phenylobacterium sp. TaxID=1871053 RepID=UPI002F94B1E6